MSDPLSVNSLPSAMQSASTAIQRGVDGVNRDAAIVASSTAGEPGEVVSSLLDSRQQLLYVQAAAKLMSTADQMLGTLVDVHA